MKTQNKPGVVARTFDLRIQEAEASLVYTASPGYIRPCKRKKKWGGVDGGLPEEMIQWLKAVAALLEDLGLAPSTHLAVHKPPINSSSRRSNSFFDLCRYVL